ncbi:hypothetical protein [Escherichia coli]|nr:hypothetical protein [Escherichia coli]
MRCYRYVAGCGKADAQKVGGGEMRRLGLEAWSAELAQEREEQSHE